MSGYPIGRLNMEIPFGTILGPTEMGEWVTVVEPVGRTALIRFATVTDLEAAKARVAEHGPRSVTEHRLFGGLR